MGTDTESRSLPAGTESEPKLLPPEGNSSAQVFAQSKGQDLLAAVRKAGLSPSHAATSPRFSLRELFAVVTVASLGMAFLRWFGPVWCAGLSGQLSLGWLGWHAIWGSESRPRWAYLIGWSLFTVYLLSLAIALAAQR